MKFPRKTGAVEITPVFPYLQAVPVFEGENVY